MVVLESQEPACYPGIGFLGSGHPLKRSMVCDEGKGAPEEITAKFQDCPLNGQSLSFDSCIFGFCWGQLPTQKKNRMFFTLKLLGKDSAKTII